MTLDRYPGDAEIRRRVAEHAAKGAAPPVPPVPAPVTHHGRIALGPGSPLATKPRRRRSEMKDEEHEEQSRLFTWAAEQEPIYPELRLFHAIPNYSGNLPGYIAQRLKAEGKKKGVLDTCLPVLRMRDDGARRIYYGSLRIEMKTESGQLSKEQKDWVAWLRAAGNRVEICTTAEAAQAVLLHYLSLPRP